MAVNVLCPSLAMLPELGKQHTAQHSTAQHSTAQHEHVTCCLQAAERLYYIFQTLLDTEQALRAAGEEGQQAHQTALEQQQVQAPYAFMRAARFRVVCDFRVSV